ncbi:MAG TPA: glycosyltransferase family 4 protein [Drouetiella sp.]
MISREYPPDTGWGGIATFAKHLAHGLRDLGHDIEVVALAEGPAKTVDVEGIRVHRVEPYQVEGDLGAVAMCMPYSRYVLRTTHALWEKFLELHNEKPFDVVDTPELLAEGLIPAITKAAPLLIRLYTPHSKFIAEKLHSVTPSFDHQFVAMMERVAMRAADVITSPSDDLADFVSNDLVYPRENIQIVRNPIDPDVFTPDGPKELASDGRKTVLFVGRLEERKGIRYLVDAIPQITQKYKEVRFVIIGDDTVNAESKQTSVLAQLKDALAKSGCTDSVQFINRVPLNSLPSYYRSADICVVPSVYDNSPYTCLEAMSCGRTVIGTSAGGTREYIVDGESGIIIPPRDTDALAKAILDVLLDDKEQERLSQNARTRVLEKFQRKEIARQTVELYELAISRFRPESKLYRKETNQCLADADAVMYSFDKMLYDLLYQESIAFRFKHWGRLLRRRPRLMGAKVLATLMRKFMPFMPNKEQQASRLRKLEEEIRDKQKAAPKPKSAPQRELVAAGQSSKDK